LKFLSIYDNWTVQEKKIFQEGVAKYKNKSRTLYCESTGLTDNFIKNATIVNLRLAAQNIGLASPHENTQELRRKLNQFILPQNN